MEADRSWWVAWTSNPVCAVVILRWVSSILTRLRQFSEIPILVRYNSKQSAEKQQIQPCYKSQGWIFILKHYGQATARIVFLAFQSFLTETSCR